MLDFSFNPNWVSKPGSTLKDLMLLKNLTITDLAMLLQKEVFEKAEEEDLSEKEFEFIQFKCDRYVYDLLDAKIEIDDKLADKLSKIFKTSKEYWIKREEDYREGLKKIKK